MAGFFDRNRKALADQGIDPARLPPGQYSTDRFPVLHAGDVPALRRPRRLGLPHLSALVEPRAHPVVGRADALPAADAVVDIHCVTKWSKFDTAWRGVPFDTILDMAAARTRRPPT